MGKSSRGPDGRRTLRCRVEHYNFSPKGGVEGLIVTAGGRPAQVTFAPDEGAGVARSVGPGQEIDLVVAPEPPSDKGPAAHPVYRFVRLGGDDRPAAEGVVARLNYARHGEPNGVVLDTGDFVHLKPDGMRQLGLKVGDRVTAAGEARPMELGHRVVEAEEVNGVRVKGGPKHH